MNTATTKILDALYPYKLKGRGTQYRCNSPLRNDSNSQAVAITLDDRYQGGGKWFDHVAKEGGNLADLAHRMGLEVEGLPTARHERTVTKRRYDTLDAYAQAQGIPAEVLQAAGWREGQYFCPRHNRKRPALIFSTATGDRARFIDGEEPRYMSPKHYVRSWYRLECAAQIAAETGQPLVLCNGEASTVAAQYYGVAATAMTGSGEKDIPSDLLDELRACYTGPITIALDCDRTGRDAARQMLHTLQAAGYEVHTVDLNGEKGFDLANFAKLHENGTVSALAALPVLSDQEESDSALVADLRTQLAQKEAQITERDEVISTQRHIIIEQDRELQVMKMKERTYRAWLKNKQFSHAEKNIIWALQERITAQQAATPTNDEFQRVWYEGMANELGTSDDTIRNTVNKVKGKIFDYQRIGIPDPITNTKKSAVFLRVLKRPEELVTVEPEKPRNHGGVRQTCRDCGSEHLIHKVYCLECGTLQSEKVIGPPQEDEQQEAKPQLAVSVEEYIQPPVFNLLPPQVAVSDQSLEPDDELNLEAPTISPGRAAPPTTGTMPYPFVPSASKEARPSAPISSTSQRPIGQYLARRQPLYLRSTRNDDDT